MFFDLLSLLFGKIFLFTGMVQNKGTFPKPLSPEEEKKYLELSRAGDKKAKEILIKHNMRLVAHIVKKYSGAAETDDMISVGSIGLINICRRLLLKFGKDARIQIDSALGTGTTITLHIPERQTGEDTPCTIY